MSRQDFNRYELKFVISATLAARLSEDLAPFLRPDSFCLENSYYQVTSIYYDSPQLDFYWHKVDSLEHRRKVRIRFYDGTLRAFLEVKEKRRSVIAKRRVELDWESLLATADLTELCGDDEVGREVRWLNNLYDLQPVVGISYRRQALLGGDDFNRLRMTFDSDLTCGEPVGTAMRSERRFLRPDLVILEIKVNEFLPRWTLRLLQRYALVQCRYSKYCSGLASGPAQA